MTPLAKARAGIVTPEMEILAEKEQADVLMSILKADSQCRFKTE